MVGKIFLLTEVRIWQLRQVWREEYTLQKGRLFTSHDLTFAVAKVTSQKNDSH